MPWVSAQGPTCRTATPFCDAAIAPYVAGITGQNAPAGNRYGCLLSQPDPNWFTLTISRSGSISIFLTNTNNVDIDFILWGPFPDINTALSRCGNLGQTPTSTNGRIVDCSFDPAPTETVSIANAQVGEVYVLMITNFSGRPTQIFSRPNTGTGAIGCPCQFSGLSYTVNPATTGQILTANQQLARFAACQGNTFSYNIGVRGLLPSDVLGFSAAETNIQNVFGSAAQVFGPFYPIAGRFDTMDLVVQITPRPEHCGLQSYNIGITGGGGACSQVLRQELFVPCAEALDTVGCAGAMVPLVAQDIGATTFGTPSFTWRQLAGLPALLNGAGNRIATANIAPRQSTTSADELRFELEMRYGPCVSRDTMRVSIPNVNLNIGPANAVVCPPQRVNLQAILSDTFVQTIIDCDNYFIEPIAFTPEPVRSNNLRNAISLRDDELSISIPLGFNFSFYCNSYNSLRISSNGFVTFGNATATGFSPQTLPNASNPNNLIALAWTDLNPSLGGEISYLSDGVAPNRRFIVNFHEVPTVNNTSLQTVQLILYEGSNFIELHTTNLAFDRQNTLGMVQGLENANGSRAAPIPGRNNTRFNAANTSHRFRPSATTSLAPISYDWRPSGSLNDPTVFNPSAGPSATTNYTVTVTNGPCRYTASNLVRVEQPAQAPAVSCGNVTPSSITFVWTGTLPAGGFFEYSLNNGQTWINAGNNTSFTLNGLTANSTRSILVRINDGSGSGCAVSENASASCTTSPCPLSLSVLGIDSVRCFGQSNGAIRLGASQGTAPYTFVWGGGQTGPNLTGLTAGTYRVTLSDASGACSVINNNLVVGQPQNLNLSVLDQANPSCNGGTDGLISLSAAGGTAPYTYLWNNGQTSPNLTGLSSGSYRLTLSDANGCTLSSPTYNLSQPPALRLNRDTLLQANCLRGGEIRFTASGGTPPYTYNWNTGQTSPNLNNLGAGTYVLTLSDANGCRLASAPQTINPINFPTLVSSSVDSIDCHNGNNGRISLSFAGGNPPITYLWSDGSTQAQRQNLSAGTYTLTLSDALGCTLSPPSFVLSQPNPLQITLLNLVNDTCGSTGLGSIEVSSQGGVPNYRYLWNNGQTTQNLQNLQAGTYTLTLSDANDCQAIFSTQVSLPPGTVSVQIQAQDNPCAGQSQGSINAIVSGGSGFHSYLWSDGSTNASLLNLAAGTYSLTVTDSLASSLTCRILNTVQIGQPLALDLDTLALNNIDCHNNQTGLIDLLGRGGVPPYTYAWSNGATSNRLENLASGLYTLSLSDANNCLFPPRDFNLSQPDPLVFSLANLDPSGCDNSPQGSITTQTQGGTQPYQYSWNNGFLTANLQNLNSGNYQGQVLDANGCSASLTVELGNGFVTATLAVIRDSLCFGAEDGALEGQSNLGANANYLWSNGQTTALATGLQAGSYTLSVTAINNLGQTCLDTLSFTLSQPDAPLEVLLNQIQDIDCDQVPIAALQAQGIQGWGQPYTYSWNNGASSPLIENLGPASYELRLSDARDCQVTASITVTAPPLPQLAAWVGNVGQSSTTVAWGNTIELNAGFNENNAQYRWSPSTNLNQDNTASVLLEATQSGELTYFVRARIGDCETLDSVRLVVIATFTGIPTAFSPNGDGANDKFRPVELNPAFITQFEVYNRWGQRIYDNPSLSDGGWDGSFKGQPQPSDVYFYTLVFQRPQDAQPQIYRGEVTLLR